MLFTKVGEDNCYSFEVQDRETAAIIACLLEEGKHGFKASEGGGTNDIPTFDTAIDFEDWYKNLFMRTPERGFEIKKRAALQALENLQSDSKEFLEFYVKGVIKFIKSGNALRLKIKIKKPNSGKASGKAADISLFHDNLIGKQAFNMEKRQIYKEIPFNIEGDKIISYYATYGYDTAVIKKRCESIVKEKEELADYIYHIVNLIERQSDKRALELLKANYDISDYINNISDWEIGFFAVTLKIELTVIYDEEEARENLILNEFNLFKKIPYENAEGNISFAYLLVRYTEEKLLKLAKHIASKRGTVVTPCDVALALAYIENGAELKAKLLIYGDPFEDECD